MFRVASEGAFPKTHKGDPHRGRNVSENVLTD